MTSSSGPSRAALIQMRDNHVDQVVRSGTTAGVLMKGLPTVLLTYTGAKTGRERKTPVMRVEHQGCYAVVASAGGEPTNPLWYDSVVAEPVIKLQDGPVTREYRAREVFGDEKAIWWGDAGPADASCARTVLTWASLATVC